MTESEIIQNYYICMDLMATYVINFVTILSGYLLATHFLGDRMTWVQFSTLTLSYLFVMVVTIVSINLRIEEAHYLVSLLKNFDSSSVYLVSSTAAFAMLSAHILILLGSMYFGFSSVGKAGRGKNA